MKDNSNILDFITLGLDSELAEKLDSKGYTLSKLESTSASEIRRTFKSWEVPPIVEAKKRKPIPMDIVQKLVQESDWKCCICWDISQEKPVVIHHIAKHARTQDDSYENLVVLCTEHHALAHSKWELSRHPLPATLLKQRKEEWIKAVSEFKQGLRSAPSTGLSRKEPFNQSDIEAIGKLRAFIDRPAMHQPFNVEGNMLDFLTAITDIIRALNTGILKTREGDEISRTKPRSLLSNPKWRDKLEIIATRFEELRTRFEIAVRDGEMQLGTNGFYAFHNRGLPNEIDAIRDSIVLLFNGLLQEAGLPSIRGVGTAMRFGRRGLSPVVRELYIPIDETET